LPLADIFRLKCTKFDFGWSSTPDPAGVIYSAPPDSLAGLQGPYILLRGNEWRGKEGAKYNEGKGNGKREGKVPLLCLPVPLS